MDKLPSRFHERAASYLEQTDRQTDCPEKVVREYFDEEISTSQLLLQVKAADVNGHASSSIYSNIRDEYEPSASPPHGLADGRPKMNHAVGHRV